MPFQPTSQAVHVNVPLTNISVAYIQSEDNFIANKVFPIVPVDKKSDVYYIYTKADWFRDEAQMRKGGTQSAGSGYGLSTTSYECIPYAIHKDIDDQTRANTDSILNPDRDATTFVTQRLLLKQEIQWVSDYFTTSIWGTDKTVTTQWDNYTSSTPLEDVDDGISTILSNTGFRANTLVIGWNVFKRLRRHPHIVDLLKYTNSGAAMNVTPALLAQVLGVDRVLISQAIKNTGLEGETASYSFIAGNSALLCYTTNAPSLMSPTAGYIFMWKDISRGLGKTIGIKKFRMEEIESDRIEGQIAFADKVVATDLGYFFPSVVAS